MVIKHIFFDIGGVLLEIDQVQSLQYWSDCTDLSIDTIKNHFPHKAHEQYEIGKLRDYEFFRAVKDALPKPNCLKEDDFWRGWNKLIAGETETVKLLPLLYHSYNIYLLSNTNPRHIKYEVEARFSNHNNVDRAFYSFDLGCRKPSKEIYLKALELAGATPEESLLIDDAVANIETAKTLGYITIHHTDYRCTAGMFYDIGLIDRVD